MQKNSRFDLISRDKEFSQNNTSLTDTGQTILIDTGQTTIAPSQ